MKKLVIVILCFCCLFVSCGKDPGDTVDDVVSLVVCDEFYSQTIYVGDNINLDDFTIKVTYESGRTENIKFSNAGIYALDTSVVGSKSLKLKYLEKEETITYIVNDIYAVNATYKGNTLVFRKGETPNFDNYEFTVLYINGHENIIKFSQAQLGNIDYSLTDIERTFSLTYEGVTFNVPYVVTCSEIELYKDYDFDDTLNTFINQDNLKINFSETKLIIFKETDNGIVKINEGTISESSYNRLITMFIIENKPTTVYLYLVGEIIYYGLE